MKIVNIVLSCLLLITTPLATADTHATKPVKNLILLIGDGMGPQQLGLLFSYARYASDSIYQGQPTAIEQLMDMGVTGLSLTSPADKLVVDSACSATQLATGFVAGSEMIGVNAEGNPVETVLELAQKQGKATGLVSDTRLTHATPAAFAAHQPHRSLENEIAVDMLAQGVDVMLSGGLRHWLPQAVNDKGELYQTLRKQSGGHIKIKSKRKDQRNLLQEAEAAGYDVALNRDELQAAKGPVLGLFSYSGMADGIQHHQHKDKTDRKQPTLKEMTIKALDILAKDPDGFFLMVEAGQIDWAGHGNDVGTTLHELLKFDETIAYVNEWAAQHDDTIIVLTADHETGGFGFSYSDFQTPKGKALAGAAFKDRLFKPKYNFIDRSVLSQIYKQGKSYRAINDELDQLAKEKQTPAKVAEVIQRHTGFDVAADEAAYYLGQTEGHDTDHPHVHDFKDFYVYSKRLGSNLIGRILAKHQGVTWSTGTHTATPVTVTAVGPAAMTQAVNGLNSHPEIGELLKQWISVD